MMKNLRLLHSKPERLVLAAVLLKGLVYPGWYTCVELGFALAFCAYRWHFEPKEVAPMSLDDAAKLQGELSSVKGEMGMLKTWIGFDPKARFSMFNHKRG